MAGYTKDAPAPLISAARVADESANAASAAIASAAKRVRVGWVMVLDSWEARSGRFSLGARMATAHDSQVSVRRNLCDWRRALPSSRRHLRRTRQENETPACAGVCVSPVQLGAELEDARVVVHRD